MSNKMIDEAMFEARRLSAEALEMMSKANEMCITELRERMMDIVANPTKLLSENFMMNMFIKYVDALPPFKEYWEHLYENKRMRVMAAESGATVLQFAELKERALPSK